ncbi:hypothetical protein L218DRAFT_948709 [Marasmius fiardii PR-910]|nr:hypothetical protein L218DRAFT_948709 [Marasmius fiardii PR-910]
MTSHRQHQHYPAPATMFKGGACTNCRKRKIRCDGARPLCRTCRTSSNQFSDCEYTDSGATASQRLEEQIAILEARLHELEAQPSPQYSSPQHPSSQHSSPAHSSHSHSSPLSQHPALSSTSNPDLTVSHHKAQDALSLESLLSAELHQTLFMQHTADLAFFLNTERFLGSSLKKPNPATHALLDVIYLWSIHLSPKPLCQHELQFLSKALRNISHGIANSQDAGQLIHMIQASVLIAQYFFRNSRFLEGKYHMTNAHSLAIGARLHTIRSVEPGRSPFAVSFSPPQDAIEEGERINAFWSVVILNTCWMSVDGSPSNMIYTHEPGLRIDTPWPEDMDTYTIHGIPSNLVGNQTVERFLRGVNTGDNPNGGSWTALHAKASILFERATQVGLAHWRNISTHSPNTPGSSAQFLAIHSAIQALFQDLSNKQASSSVVAAPPTQRLGVVVSLLANVARIRLYEKFTDRCEQSDYYVINSARDVVHIVATHYAQDRRSVLDPIIAVHELS